MVLQFSSIRVFPDQGFSPAVVQPSASALPNANRVVDGVYIGDFQLALQVLCSKDHMGITHVLSLVSSSILSSMCNSCECAPASIFSSNETPSSVHFQTAKRGSRLLRMVVPLMDTPEEDISQVLQPCIEFIDEGRRHGTVLVHCVAGRSRSAAIVIAYLMKTMGLPMKQAMEVLNKNYKKASPNVGYMQQLEHFEMQQRNTPEGLCNGMSANVGYMQQLEHFEMQQRNTPQGLCNGVLANVGYMQQLEHFEMQQRNTPQGLCNGMSVCSPG